MRLVFPPATGRLINDLATDMNAFVESILGEEGGDKPAQYAPPMDVEESDEGYEFSFDLPGVKPEDIHVDVEEQSLTIHGSRHRKVDDQDEGRRRVERVFGEFRRVLRIPKTVDLDKIAASYEHGVLSLHLPKAAEKGVKRVVVTHAGQSDAK